MVNIYEKILALVAEEKEGSMSFDYPIMADFVDGGLDKISSEITQSIPNYIGAGNLYNHNYRERVPIEDSANSYLGYIVLWKNGIPLKLKHVEVETWQKIFDRLFYIKNPRGVTDKEHQLKRNGYTWIGCRDNHFNRYRFTLLQDNDFNNISIRVEIDQRYDELTNILIEGGNPDINVSFKSLEKLADHLDFISRLRKF